MTRSTTITDGARSLLEKMSGFELIAATFVGRTGKTFTEDGLRKGLKEVLGERAPDQNALYQMLLVMNGGIFFESGDFTYSRITEDEEMMNIHLLLLAERGYDCGKLERLQPAIDEVWKYARACA